MRVSSWSTVLLLWVVSSAWAAPGVMIKSESMRASPSAAAAEVGRVGKGAAVEIVGRQGGWTQIRAGGKTGWVRLLSVRGGSATSTDVAGEIRGIVGLGTTRRDPGKVVAIAGVRGLNEEELRNARLDESELQQLEGYAAGREDAARFAAEAGLVSRRVAYLPAPKNSGGVRK